MSKKIYDLTIPAGQYTDKSGKTHTNWENIGAVFKGDNGKFFITLRRTFNPAGVPIDEKGTNRESIFISLFTAEDRKEGYRPVRSQHKLPLARRRAAFVRQFFCDIRKYTR